MDILSALRLAVTEHQLFLRGSTVVVGVSGGPDSLCLLHALRELAPEYDLRLHVAHLNHQLRAEAGAEADFVRDIAQRWKLPCTIEARAVQTLAQTERLSIEEAARQMRYGFLIDVAVAHGSTTIAVAHNADDQAESVLMHFLRGSGLAGLRGMLPHTSLREFGIQNSAAAGEQPAAQIQLVRPLLEVPRHEIEAYCARHQLPARLDPTNADPTYFRNRLRHELLPLLETYNPQIRSILRRTAAVVAAEYEEIERQTQQAWNVTARDESAAHVTFDLAAWREQPLARQRALVRQAIQHLRPPLRDIHFGHVEEAVDLLRQATTGAQLTLPRNLRLEVGYDSFTIARREQPVPLDWPQLPEGAPEGEAARLLAVPGRTPLPESEWVIEATSGEDAQAVNVGDDAWTAYFDLDTLPGPLVMRPRARGDRFQPQGLPAPVRLKDWMINVKVPRAVRARLPLIESGGQIVWVPGFRLGQPFIVRAATQRLLKLVFKKGLRMP